MKLLLRTSSHSLDDVQFRKLAQLTEGYSGSDIKALCQDAALGPIRGLQLANIAIINVDVVPPMTYEDFQASLLHVRPSVAQQDLDLYLQWNAKFGSFPAAPTPT